MPEAVVGVSVETSKGRGRGGQNYNRQSYGQNGQNGQSVGGQNGQGGSKGQSQGQSKTLVRDTLIAPLKLPVDCIRNGVMGLTSVVTSRIAIGKTG